jgi:hypothetical protein
MKERSFLGLSVAWLFLLRTANGRLLMWISLFMEIIDLQSKRLRKLGSSNVRDLDFNKTKEYADVFNVWSEIKELKARL